MKAILHEARPRELYDYDDALIAEIEQSLCSSILRVQPRCLDERRPELSGYFLRPLEVKDRCGRPFWRSFKRDERYMFLGWIFHKDWHCLTIEQCHALRKEQVSSFSIKREIFLAFFGEALSGCESANDDDPSRDNETVSRTSIYSTDTSTRIPDSMSSALFQTIDNTTQGWRLSRNDNPIAQCSNLYASISLQTPHRLNRPTTSQHWVRRQGYIPENANEAELLAFYRHFLHKTMPLMLYDPQNRLFNAITGAKDSLKSFIAHMNRHTFWIAESDDQWRVTSLYDLFYHALANGNVIVFTPFNMPF